MFCILPDSIGHSSRCRISKCINQQRLYLKFHCLSGVHAGKSHHAGKSQQRQKADQDNHKTTTPNRTMPIDYNSITGRVARVTKSLKFNTPWPAKPLSEQLQYS